MAVLSVLSPWWLEGHGEVWEAAAQAAAPGPPADFSCRSQRARTLPNCGIIRGALPAIACRRSRGWVMANVVTAEGALAFTLPFSCFYVEVFMCERLGSVIRGYYHPLYR